MESKNNISLKKQWFIQSKNANIDDFYQYNLKKPLGSGAFGTVYQGKLKGTSDKMIRAIKKIPKRKVRQGNQNEFKNQIEILQKLDHPNIVRLYQTYEDPRNIYMVTQLCTGGQLFDRIIQKQHFTEQQAKSVFRQMMLALNYCHTQNIAHRDLKPQNFLYLNTQETSPIKLIDFGLSIRFSKQQKEKKKNMKTLVGTSYYMAPQIMSGIYDHTCDIWSAGVILYILVTGIPPFNGQNDDQILEQVRSMKYTFDIPEMKNVSSSLKDLIARMLVVSNKRPSASQILNDKWLKQIGSHNHLKLNVKTMKAFSTYSKLKKLGVTLIATQMPEKDIISLGNLFKQIDKDNNGVLSFQQIKFALQSQKQNKQTINQIKKIMQDIDSDHNGSINYTQFIASCLDYASYAKQQNVRLAFKTLDVNGDGKIEKSELYNLLEREQFHVNNEFLDNMIKQCDVNNDGSIDFDEFLYLITSKK